MGQEFCGVCSGPSRGENFDVLKNGTGIVGEMKPIAYGVISLVLVVSFPHPRQMLFLPLADIGHPLFY